LLPEKYIELDWMIPAPAQGAVVVTARSGEAQLEDTVKSVLNDTVSEKITGIERDFMRTLEGGCTSPIGAHAQLSGTSHLSFKGGVFSINGSRAAVIERSGDLKDKELGMKWAREVLAQGGDSILEELRKSQNR
jgi:hydroxymethylbilane synthase